MSHPVRTSLVGSSLLLAGLAVGFAGEEISSSTKLSKANFVEVRKAILLPSESIREGFESLSVVTGEGKTVVGLVVLLVGLVVLAGLGIGIMAWPSHSKRDDAPIDGTAAAAETPDAS